MSVAHITQHTNTRTIHIPLYTKQNTYKSHKTHIYTPHKTHKPSLTVRCYQLHPDRLHYSFPSVSLNLCFEVISELQTVSKLKLVQRMPLYAFHVYCPFFYCVTNYAHICPPCTSVTHMQITYKFFSYLNISYMHQNILTSMPLTL